MLLQIQKKLIVSRSSTQRQREKRGEKAISMNVFDAFLAVLSKQSVIIALVDH